MMSQLVIIWLVYCVFLGVFTGFVSGALGLGGGIVVVPALLYLFQKTGAISNSNAMLMAVGTSFAVMVFSSLASLRSHSQRGAVLWPVVLKLLPGLVLGTMLGGVLSSDLSTTGLKTLLGVFLLGVAIDMLFKVEVTSGSRYPTPLINGVVSLTIGVLSGLLGIGGSILLVPYLRYCGIEPRQISPITACCSLTVASTGLLTYLMNGLYVVDLPWWSLGYIVWPVVLLVAVPSLWMVPFGVRLIYVLPVRYLQYGFIVMLLVSGVNLLLR
jgi:uncharacterized membrane protein YfcA